MQHRFIVFGLLSGCFTQAPTLDWKAANAIGEAPTPVSADEVVFVALGDFGKQTNAQARVAEQVRTACDAAGCQFLLMLGDNLYEQGLHTDGGGGDLRALIDTYPPLPAYLALGNHDWDPIRPSLTRADRELSWIESQQNVFGAYHFYSFTAGPLQLWVADTNYLVRHEGAASAPELQQWAATIAQSEAPWKLVAGHHPLLSNGLHGNAGSYHDGGQSDWPGKDLSQWFEEQVVGKADLILAGHDHNLSFFPTAGTLSGGEATASLVSGAAAKCRGVRGPLQNPQLTGATAAFEHYGYGFAIVRATRAELEVTFYAEGQPPWTARRGQESSVWTTDAPHVDRQNHCD